jgi:hypothetical protein
MPKHQPRRLPAPPPRVRTAMALDQAASVLTATVAYERAGLVDEGAVEAARWTLVTAAMAFRAAAATSPEESAPRRSSARAAP